MARRVSKKAEKKYVFDTNVFIELFRGYREEIRDFFVGIERKNRVTTVINLMELYEGAKSVGKAEIDKVDDFIRGEGVKIVPITKRASHRAIELMRKYTPTQGLEAKDAFIAAVCLEKNYILVTMDNIFEKLKPEGLEVIRPIDLEGDK